MLASELRQQISEALRTDSDFQAFCHDCFPQVFNRFSDGMDRQQKVTLLLTMIDSQNILIQLKKISQRSSKNDKLTFSSYNNTKFSYPKHIWSYIHSILTKKIFAISILISVVLGSGFKLIFKDFLNPHQVVNDRNSERESCRLVCFPENKGVKDLLITYVSEKPECKMTQSEACLRLVRLCHSAAVKDWAHRQRLIELRNRAAEKYCAIENFIACQLQEELEKLDRLEITDTTLSK